jgi:hypothetical protein
MSVSISLQDSRFNYSYKGFCSIVCSIIDIALEHYSVFDNIECCVQDHQTLQLFDSLYECNEVDYDAGSWWLDRFFNHKLHHPEYSAHTIANIENLKLKNMIFNNILRIKSDTLKEFETKYQELGVTSNTLGVQIRGTDKKTEIPEPCIDNITRKIDYYFDETDVENLFLATDDIKYLKLIQERYGNLVICDEKVSISHTDKPLHTLPYRDKINEEVLSCVYILSRCSHFMYSFSNVSLLALILGVNNHKTITNLNK